MKIDSARGSGARMSEHLEMLRRHHQRHNQCFLTTGEQILRRLSPSVSMQRLKGHCRGQIVPLIVQSEKKKSKFIHCSSVVHRCIPAIPQVRDDVGLWGHQSKLTKPSRDH